ncbi:MAG: V-type ATP synthase subunit E [Spirochaetia bacterium]
MSVNMEMQLGELIQKIKNDGVMNAQQQSLKIVQEAEQKASAIVKAAQENAQKIEETAKEKAAQDEARSREALVQASRDLLLNLGSKITALFDATLGNAVATTMSGDGLQGVIVSVLSGMAKKKDYVIELSVADAKKLGDGLAAVVGKAIEGGSIEIRPTKMVSAGFRIQEKNGAAMYDFSSQTIADNLVAYVNPRLAEDIKKAAGLK